MFLVVRLGLFLFRLFCSMGGEMHLFSLIDSWLLGYLVLCSRFSVVWLFGWAETPAAEQCRSRESKPVLCSRSGGTRRTRI